MTIKEALEILVNNLDQAKMKELSSSDDYWTKYEEVSEAINVLENLINSGMREKENEKRR